MSHPLQDQVRSLARTARHWSALRLVVGAASLLVSLALVAGGIDYLARLEDSGLRLILSGLVGAGVLGWAWGQFRRWAQPTTELAVARRVERWFPQLRDRLSSALDFLRRDERDVACGSPRLRQAAIEEVTAECRGLDFRDCLDRAAVGRAFWLAAIAATALALAVATRPDLVRLGAQRLATPWGGPAWPRRHALSWSELPRRIARGESLLLRVVDSRGRLPRSGVAWVWREGELESAATPLPLTLDGQVLRGELESLTRSVRVRVEADDGRIPWTVVEVVEPPTIELVEATVFPPEYARRPPETSDGRIRGLVGSRVELSLTLDQPVSAAHLQCDHPLSPGSSSGSEAPTPRGGLFGGGRERLPLKLSDGGRRLRWRADGDDAWRLALPSQSAASPAASAATAPPSAAGPSQGSDESYYWLELFDLEGRPFPVSRRWQVEVLADPPPQVVWLAPSPDAVVTTRGEIELQLLVRDNLDLERVELQVARFPLTAGATENEAGTAEVAPPVAEPFYQPPYRPLPSSRTPNAFAPSRPDPAARGSQPESTSLPPDEAAAQRDAWPRTFILHQAPAAGAGESTLELRHRLDLSDWGLAAGDRLELRVVALDHVPSEGESEPRSLLVVSAEEWTRRTAQQRDRLVGRLAELIEQQRQVRTRTGAMERDLSSLPARDLADQLQGAELAQRRVAEALADGDASLLSLLHGLIAELRRNRGVGMETEQPWVEASARVEEASRERVPPALRALREALATARAATGQASTARDPLADAAHEASRVERLRPLLRDASAAQAELLDHLQRTFDRLARWDDFRRFNRELELLLQAEQRLHQETRRRQAQGLADAPRGGEDSLAAEQLLLALDYDKQLARIGAMAAETRAGEDPGESAVDSRARGMLVRMLRLAESLRIGGRMRAVAAALRGGELGRAAEDQLTVVAGLRQLLDALEGRPPEEAAARRTRLEQAVRELAELRSASLRLAGDWERGTNADAPLVAPLATELSSRVAELGQALATARDAGAGPTQSAAEGLLRAATAAEARRGDLAAAATRQAAADLAAAGRMLAEELGSLQAQQAGAELDALRESLRPFVDRQRELRASTERALGAEPIDPAPLAMLSEQQAALASSCREFSHGPEIAALEPQLSKLVGVQLGAAAEAMRDAETKLRLSPPASIGALLPQRQALRILERLLESLGGLGAFGSGSPTDTEAPSAPPDGDAGGEQISWLELRLLRDWQQACLEATRTWARETAGIAEDDLTPVQRRQRDELARQQSQVVAQLQSLVGDRAGDTPSDSTPASDLPNVDTPAPAKPPAPKEVDPLDSLLGGASPNGADQSSNPARNAIKASQPGSVPSSPPREQGAGASDRVEPSSQDGEPLRAILQAAGQARDALTAGNAGAETERAQEAVVAGLDALLERTRQASPPAGAPTPGSAGQEGLAGGATGASGEPPGSTGVGAERAPAGLAPIWGHLPPRLREQMLGSGVEEFLPEYAELIEQFYRRLAERERTPP